MSENHERRPFAPETHRDYLRLLARIWLPRRVQCKLDASDVVQDTLLKAHAKHEQFEGKTLQQYKVWLRTALRRSLIDTLRKLRLPEESIRETESQSHGMEEWLAAGDASVGSQIANEELLEVLARSLAELPEEQQEVLVLKHFRGWKVETIAAELGRTRASVAGLLRRGLNQLRQDPRLRNTFVGE
jgi:RNA polymerase sigma-70 factor (ECF subfamily)